MNQTHQNFKAHAEPSHIPYANTVMTIIGGDTRMRHMASFLASVGHHVHTVALGDTLPHGVKHHQRLCHISSPCQVVILPLPVTRDKEHIQTPLDPDSAVGWEELKSYLSSANAPIIFGGRIPKDWQNELCDMGCRVFDYEDSEELQVKNAYITAEGAVMTAMELTDTILKDTSLAIIGYGRIGQALSKLLLSMGAHVTVYARKEASRVLASTNGCSVHSTTQLDTLTSGFGVIFNTVPVHLVGQDIWERMPCQTLLIDLSSAPFGIHPQVAGELTNRCGLGVVYAPALPGRYAPKTAGEMLGAHILTTLERGGTLP